MDRRELLKRGAFAGLILALPAPAARYLEDLAEEMQLDGLAPSVAPATVMVARGWGPGKIATMMRVSPDLLDDHPHGLRFVQAASVEQMLVLQERSPGRATLPVERGGDYELVDHRTKLAIGDWREFAIPDMASEAGLLRLEMINA